MADIAPSSRCPRAEILKTASHEPIVQPIVDWFGQNNRTCDNMHITRRVAHQTAKWYFDSS